MMLDSNAAAGLNPRGLRQPFPGGGKAFGRGHPVRTRTRAGWSGRERALSGMGLTLEQQSMAYDWRTAPAVFAPTPEWTARYGAGGSYSQERSVVTAREEAARSAAVNAPGASSAPPMQYAMESCTPTDTACVARNELRQQANMVLAENARRAFNMEVCLYNVALNPGTAQYEPCRAYATLPVPAAPGVPVAAVATPGGGYAAPITDETAAQQAANLRAWTAQQAASAATNQPNQNVPPRPQGGEVPTGTRTTFSIVDESGKILGLEPMTLALIAAGVGALMLLKK